MPCTSLFVNKTLKLNQEISLYQNILQTRYFKHRSIETRFLSSCIFAFLHFCILIIVKHDDTLTTPKKAFERVAYYPLPFPVLVGTITHSQFSF